ncbi:MULTISPECIES: PD-(D/E)XK nuclease family protein [Pseudoalteromonas]|uniref:PD-(D/E)XK nuclease family protein n=1 Tax=Pseudoalteromonas obscura TaxID=3048491 RepID=A0ABT7EK47_9GAMM|nr:MULTISPECIES: PD-(D/E)XK nuclease family protein [Pseudoalteromonas]MBQ4837340.1 PD-(D/E)XK nuclease family protein [Pseudoalteromonas luteoviolacea]MDK2595436.1 PD-(D/E)XK nuclease family protein [Pseudoalteromonas sp. P94(2023)]
MSTQTLKALCNLVIDKDFQALTSRCEQNSVLELFSLDENRKSAVLAWLLDPMAGHQQGDYFLRALLNHVYSCASDEQLELFPSAFELASSSFCQTKVMTELQANSARIDLALLDPNQELLIIIERKDGSKLHNDQLKKYANWAEKNYSGWKKVYILSDSHFQHHGAQYDKRYVKVDDTWLQDALRDLFDRALLTSKHEHQLKDLYHYVFGTWSEKTDPYYQGRSKLLKQVSAGHCELIRQLESEFIKVGTRRCALITVTPAMFFGKILPAKQKYDDDTLQKALIVQKHHNVFEQLHGLNEFDLFNEWIKKTFPNFVTEIYSDSVICMLKKHRPASGYWPYYLDFERKKSDDNEIYYTLTIHVCRKGLKSHHELAEQVAESYEMKRQSNWRFRHLSLIERFDSLDFNEQSDVFLAVVELEKRLTPYNVLENQ